MTQSLTAPGGRSLLLLLVGGLVLAGCSIGRTTRTETLDENGGTRGSSISLHGSAVKALLERGKQATMDGEYGVAEEAFREVYERADASPDQRAEALLSLGETYANVLNPRRDREKALESFRKLVVEFPDSELRATAEERIRGLDPQP